MKKAYEIKRAQKESLFTRAITTLFSQATRDDAALEGIYVSRVELAPDRSTCYVFFYTADGLEGFEKKLKQLLLYKPSLRASLAKQIANRYTPDLIFKYDAMHEKSMRIDNLLEGLKNKGEL